MGTDPEAALAAQAATAMSEAQYVDLPAWIRPGRKVAVVNYGTASGSVYFGKVVKILRRDIVIVTDGDIETRYNRETLRHATTGYGGSVLHDPHSDHIVNKLAAVTVRNAARGIEKAAQAKVEDVDAALYLLSQFEDMITAARGRIQARTAAATLHNSTTQEGRT